MAKASHKNGKEWEDILNKQFDKYRKNGDMYIIKVHTDWVVIRKGKNIVSAFPKAKSDCLDYIGLFPDNKGSIIFEAKSSDNKTSFPLSLIKDYQYDLNNELYNYTDKVFYLIRMNTLGEIYFASAKQIQEFKDENDRKSIPIKYMRDNFRRCDDLNFLKIIREME